MDNKQKNVIKSGSYCKCEACGHVGYVYGVATSQGISAPFCSKCGKNNKLVVINKEK